MAQVPITHLPNLQRQPMTSKFMALVAVVGVGVGPASPALAGPLFVINFWSDTRANKDY